MRSFMDAQARNVIAEIASAQDVMPRGRMGTLWGGYGQLHRVALVGTLCTNAVVKWVSPPSDLRRTGGVSHKRKCRSYDVETAFYRTFAARCDDACRVPRLLGARAANDTWILVLEDLDAAGFDARIRARDARALDACVAWLAAFHARFVHERPEGLWPVGTYWHLGTRQEELARMRDKDLQRAASGLDRALRDATFRTLVHGDAKPDNFCFDQRASRVAAVDFQYVGGGVGVQDLAYLLYGSSRGQSAQLIGTYFDHLRAALPAAIDAAALEAEWRGLFAVAIDDFRRFLDGWSG
jgi:hypothetical protein